MKVLRRIRKAFASFLDLLPFFFNKSSPPPSLTPGRLKNILVFGYGGLGDMVFLLPAVASLRRWLPEARITMVIGTYSAAKDLIPEKTYVNEMIVVDWLAASGSDRRRINQRLIEMKFDACVSGYTNPVRFFLPLLAKIPVRAGHLRKLTPVPRNFKDWFELNIWQEELYRKKVLNRPVVLDIDGEREHDIEKNLRMITALGAPAQALDKIPKIEIPKEAVNAAQAFLDSNGVRSSDKLLGLSLGVSGGMDWKKWDMNRMAALAQRICVENSIRLIVFGSDLETPLLDEFRKYFAPPVVVALGKTSVLEMAALLKRCRMFLSNDCGPSKLAMAVQVPTGILWGPSDRWGAGPWVSTPHVSVHNAMPCSPCFRVGLAKTGKGVINYTNCGHHACLKDLSVDHAYEALKPLIKSSTI